MNGNNTTHDPSPSYLFLTWRETYLALKFSIIARLAWSISFWARPRRLWERFTACHRPECEGLVLVGVNSTASFGVFGVWTYQGCDVSVGDIVWVLLPGNHITGDEVRTFTKWCTGTCCTNAVWHTHILARTYPTIFPFSSSAIYDSWNIDTWIRYQYHPYDLNTTTPTSCDRLDVIPYWTDVCNSIFHCLHLCYVRWINYLVHCLESSWNTCRKIWAPRIASVGTTRVRLEVENVYLWPGQPMIEVIFHLIIFRKT